jgi:predicted anti-sigma-YlaC factor YlaD
VILFLSLFLILFFILFRFRPLIFFGIVTVLAAAYSHGCKYLMKDLGNMSKSFINALCDSVSVPVSDSVFILFRFRPLIFFGIVSVLAAAYSHGCKYLMKDLGDMSKSFINALYDMILFLILFFILFRFRPLIFFGIVTVLAAAYSHGCKYLMKDLGDMSKMPLTHYISSHLSVIYSTVVPVLLLVSFLRTQNYSSFILKFGILIN